MLSTVSEKEVLKSPVAISISELSKSFNNEQFRILEDVNLTIGNGEFFIILAQADAENHVIKYGC
ncbi:hypothetical protein AAHB49_02145 [Bacillus cereus]